MPRKINKDWRHFNPMQGFSDMNEKKLWFSLNVEKWISSYILLILVVKHARHICYFCVSLS